MSTLKWMGIGLGALVLTVGLGAGAYVSAQNPDGPQGPFMGRRGGPGGPGGPGRFGAPGGPGGPMAFLGPMIASRLNLTDAQEEQVKNILNSHRDQLKALGDRAMEAQQALHAAVTADALDEGLIRARAADRATVEADLAVAHAQIHAEVFRILTPEQRAQAKEMQSNMQQRLNQRREQPQPGR